MEQSLSQASRDLDALVIDRIDGRDVTRGEFSSAFDRVANPTHWKLGIDAVVDVADARDLEVVLRSVEFFTGSRATAGIVRPGRYRVTAAGYYAAIGA